MWGNIEQLDSGDVELIKLMIDDNMKKYFIELHTQQQREIVIKISKCINLILKG